MIITRSIFFGSLAVSLTLCSCNRVIEKNGDVPVQLEIRPTIIDLDRAEGYSINPTTGLAPMPIMHKDGSTVLTGRAFPIKETPFPPDSALPAHDHRTELIPNGKAVLIPEIAVKEENHFSIVKAPLDQGLMTRTKLKEPSSEAYIINSIGDTIPTRRPIVLSPQIIPCRFPESQLSKTPVLRAKATFEFQTYEIDQGLNSLLIHDIRSDALGHLWFTGSGAGSSRFDGTNFWHFTEESGCPGLAYIMRIVFDKDGGIWFATITGGLIHFDGFNYNVYSEIQGLSSTNIRGLCSDSKGNIWIGTWAGGLIKYDHEGFTHYSVEDGLTGDIIRNIEEDREGNIWFTCYTGGLMYFDGDEFIQLGDQNGLPDKKINGLSQRKEGGVWVATYSGLFAVTTSETIKYNFESNEKCNGLVTVYEARNGAVWGAPYCGGLIKLQDGEISYYEEKHGIGEDKILAISEDEAGNIWLGSQGSGLMKFTLDGYTYLRKSDGLVKNNIKDISRSNNGSIALCSWNNGFSLYDKKTLQNYLLPGSTAENVIGQIYEDSKNRTWITTQSPGVFCVIDNNVFRYTRDQGLSSNNIHKVLEASNGDILIGTHQGGLCRFDGENFSRLSIEEGLPSSVIIDLGQDSSGVIWVSTHQGGLSKYDGDSLYVYSEKEGLPSNSIDRVVVEPDGGVWLTFTNQGIGYLKGDELALFNSSNGLRTNAMTSVTRQSDSLLFFGSNLGITLLSMRKDVHTGTSYTLKNYASEDGLRWQDVQAGLVDGNDIWWASGKGVMKGSLQRLLRTGADPVIQLNQIKLNEKLIHFNSDSGLSRSGITFKEVLPFNNVPEGLTLAYEVNNISFTFSGIEWFAPHKVKYSYKLDGIDKNWSATTSDNNAVYKNLPFGKYTLRTRAMGEGQKWGEVNTYSFEILPPWWRTWWADLIYFILFLSLVLGYVQWRTASLKKRQKALERTVKERTAEVVAEKHEVERQKIVIEQEKEKSEELLLNILPAEIAEELKEKGSSEAQLIDHVTVLFTDFKGFTALAEQLSAKELVEDLNVCFSEFDRIIERYNIEKIKTIGDAYMAAGGLPVPNSTHAEDAVRAGLEMRDFIAAGKASKQAAGKPFFEIRIGVHTGPVVAGIVGVKKFQYDIWGDTVNTASRMESSGEVGQVNISEATYELVKENSEFSFTSRGKVEAKGKGEMEMYFVNLRV